MRESIGDGFLFARNPFFRRIRLATLRRKFAFTLSDPGSYFAFPLISLGTLLESRRVPYRDNFAALEALEAARPGFFDLRDLTANRPMPNYVLHESAHAVAFDELFDPRVPVNEALSDPKNLVRMMLCESFAMNAEYFAACCVEGRAHSWLFSISSYRHHTPKKKAVGELAAEQGLQALITAALLAFLCGNFLSERIDRKTLKRISSLSGAKPDAKLGSALTGVMQMSPEFRRDTARLFLTMYGYSRNVERVLDRDPLEPIERDSALLESIHELSGVLARDPPGKL